MRFDPGSGKLRTAILLVVAVWGWVVLLKFLAVNPLPFDFLKRLSFAHYPVIGFYNSLLALAALLLRLLLLALVTLAAESLGRRLLLLFRLRGRQDLAALVTSLALGLSFLAYFMFLLAAARLLAPAFSLALLVMVLAFALLSDGRAALGRWRGYMREAGSPAADGMLAAAILFVVFVGHLAPQTHFDVLVYHFSLPWAYLAQGGFLHADTNLFSGYPANMSMLYLLGFILGGEMLAPLLHYLVLLLCLGALYMLAARCGASGALAVLLFLTLPMLAIGSTACLADPLVFLYEFLAAYYLLGFLGEKAGRREGSALWLAALFSGLAMGTIYRSFVPALIILALVAGKMLSGGKAGRAAAPRLLAKTAALMSLPVLPWLVKNAFLAGNPFYPFFARALGGKGLSPELVEGQMDVYFGAAGADILSLFTAPWNLTMAEAGGDINFIGPLFLCLLPLALVGRLARDMKRLALFALAQYVVMGLLTPTPRHYLSFLAYFCVLIACLLGRRQHWPRLFAVYFRGFALGLVFLGALSFMRVEYLSRDPLGVALGWEGRESYLDRVMINSYSSGARFVNENIGKGEAVLLFGETRSHYFKCPVIYGTAYDPQPLFALARDARDAVALHAALKDRKVSFILENRSELVRLGMRERWGQLPDGKRAVLNDFQGKYLRAASWKKTGRVDVVVYEVK